MTIKNIILALLIFLSLVGIVNNAHAGGQHGPRQTEPGVIINGAGEAVGIDTNIKALQSKYHYVIVIFRKLVEAAQIHPKPHLAISPNGPSYSQDDTIVMSQEDLQFWLKGDPDLTAIIVGHEVAHIALGHTGNFEDRPAKRREQEKQADIFGQKFAIMAGYDGCKASSFWKEYYDVMGATPDDVNHPSPLERSNYLRCK